MILIAFVKLNFVNSYIRYCDRAMFTYTYCNKRGGALLIRVSKVVPLDEICRIFTDCKMFKIRNKLGFYNYFELEISFAICKINYVTIVNKKYTLSRAVPWKKATWFKIYHPINEKFVPYTVTPYSKLCI